MDARLRACQECDTPFSPVLDEDPCEDCSRERNEILTYIQGAMERSGLKTAKQIAKHIGLPVAKVHKVLNSSSLLAHAVTTNEICVSCNERPAQPAAEYCLSCRLELHKSLGDAAGDLQAQVQARARRSEAQYRDAGVSDLLARKRRRTGSYRFDPSPKRSKR